MNTHSNRFVLVAGGFALAALAVAVSCSPPDQEPSTVNGDKAVSAGGKSSDIVIFHPPPTYPITYVPGTTFLRTNQRISPPISLADSQDYVFAMADYDRDGIDDLYCVRFRNGASRFVEVHVLSGASGFTTFLAHQTTLLVSSIGVDFMFLFGDYDHDGIPDLYAVKTQLTDYGVVELWVYRGSDQYQTVLSISYPTIHTGQNTPPVQPVIPSDTVTAYGLGDADGDGNLDLYAIANHVTASGFIEISTFHVFENSAAVPYSFPFHTSRTQLKTGDGNLNDFQIVTDYNHDGHADLVRVHGFYSNTHSMELEVVDGASDFQNIIVADGSDIQEADGLNYTWAIGDAAKAAATMSAFGVRRGFPLGTNPPDMELDVLDTPAWCIAGPVGQSCAGYACCDTTLQCNGVQCLEPNGETCSSASVCYGGACLNGVCTTCTAGGKVPSSGSPAQCCAGETYANGICVKACALPKGSPCTVTSVNGQLVKGACQQGTVTDCQPDGTYTCTPSAPKAETCNGIDDDCDGKVDNLPPTPCTVTVNGGCSVTTGHNMCVGGAPKCEATAGVDYCTRCGQTVNGASCGDCGGSSCSTDLDCPPNTMCDIISNVTFARGCKQLTACSNNVACWFPSSLTYNRCLACFSPFPVPPGGGNTNLCGNTTVDGGAPADGGAK